MVQEVGVRSEQQPLEHGNPQDQQEGNQNSTMEFEMTIPPVVSIANEDAMTNSTCLINIFIYNCVYIIYFYCYNVLVYDIVPSL